MYIEYSDYRGEREPRTAHRVRNISKKVAFGQDLKREHEISRKASKMKTLQAEKTTYARTKRHICRTSCGLQCHGHRARWGEAGEETGQGSRDPFV